MSAPDTTKKSFFSGLHLVISGLAALVTASVAVLGLALNQGWIGGGSKSSHSDSTTAPQYLVAPASIVFQPLQPTTAAIEVSNSGTLPMTVQAPTVTGPNAQRFTATIGTCDGPIDPGRSCQLQVTFRPLLGKFSATVVVKVKDAVQATEIAITGTGI